MVRRRQPAHPKAPGAVGAKSRPQAQTHDGAQQPAQVVACRATQGVALHHLLGREFGRIGHQQKLAVHHLGVPHSALVDVIGEQLTFEIDLHVEQWQRPGAPTTWFLTGADADEAHWFSVAIEGQHPFE